MKPLFLIRSVSFLTICASALLIFEASAQSARISSRDALGCYDREIQDRLATIANSGDHEAFKKLATPMVLAGKCQIIEKGTSLLLEDTATWSGLACFRPVGKTSCLWMASDLTR